MRQTISGVPTSIAAFVGRTASGPTDRVTTCLSFADFENIYGAVTLDAPLSCAVQDFFNNGGTEAIVASAVDASRGIALLDDVDLFNILCIPPDRCDGPDTPPDVYRKAAEYCRRRRAFLIIDPPAAWSVSAKQNDFNFEPPVCGSNCAVYFPHVVKADPDTGKPTLFPPSGLVAGIIARTDAQRGVWTAPAGREASLRDVLGLEVDMTDEQSGRLESAGINSLRTFPDAGPVVWGARTARAANADDDYKYIPIRRFAFYIEESVLRGTAFAVFEPNGESLWATLRSKICTFMADLERQGAIFDYQVRCDETTTTQADIDAGVVNITIGFAPLKPAEFVVLRIQQVAEPARC